MGASPSTDLPSRHLLKGHILCLMVLENIIYNPQLRIIALRQEIVHFCRWTITIFFYMRYGWLVEAIWNFFFLFYSFMGGGWCTQVHLPIWWTCIAFPQSCFSFVFSADGWLAEVILGFSFLLFSFMGGGWCTQVHLSNCNVIGRWTRIAFPQFCLSFLFLL